MKRGLGYKISPSEKQNLAVQNKKTPPSFCLNEKALLTKKIRKIFITPTGKIFDSGAILKTIEENK